MWGIRCSVLLVENRTAQLLDRDIPSHELVSGIRGIITTTFRGPGESFQFDLEQLMIARVWLAETPNAGDDFVQLVILLASVEQEE